MDGNQSDCAMNQPEPFNLACACKLGRLLAGHDPITSVRQFAPTLKQAVESAMRKEFASRNGNVRATAVALGVSRNTIYKVCLPIPKNVIRLAACLAVFVCGVANAQIKGAQFLTNHRGTEAQSSIALPALPKRTLSAVPQVKTNGVVTLQWSNGDPAETAIVNQTAGVVYPTTTNATLTVGGLAVGGRQTFVATNTAGASLPVTTVIAADSLTLKFSTWLYLTWDGPPGTLQTSTNTVIWRDLQPIATGGGYIVTNSAARGFYRVKL